MLLPKKMKYRKHQRGRRRGYAKGQTTVQFGDFGLKALETGWVTNRQIEGARIAMTRKIKRGGKGWINVFPDKPTTQKPAETRMGSGKGAPEHWGAVVKPGRGMFELAGGPEPVAEERPRRRPAAKRETAETKPAAEKRPAAKKAPAKKVVEETVVEKAAAEAPVAEPVAEAPADEPEAEEPVAEAPADEPV